MPKEELVELCERGGFVGREMRYSTPLTTLPAHLQHVLRELPRARERAGAGASKGNVPTSSVFVSADDERVELDFASSDPDTVEELLEELRAHPVPSGRRPGT